MKDTVYIRVSDQNGSYTVFKIKRTTPMKKLITAYCYRVCNEPSELRFLYNGSSIGSDQTPEEIGIVDDDVIDVVLEQVGGGA